MLANRARYILERGPSFVAYRPLVPIRLESMVLEHIGVIKPFICRTRFNKAFFLGDLMRTALLILIEHVQAAKTGETLLLTFCCRFKGNIF